MSNTQPWDALIVGGGPAGLSAALILGRCRRRGVVCDSGHYRNQAAYSMFGFLSRDGVSPEEFLKISRRQLRRYKEIEYRKQEVVSVARRGRLFAAGLKNGEEVLAKGVILATGMRDTIPPLNGIEKFFGRSVFLCPYCDGWEFKDRSVAVYGQGDRGPCFALLMRKWTSKVILCADGTMGGILQERRRLKQLNIPVIETPIERLEGSRGQLQRIVFRDKTSIEVSSLFFNTPMEGNSELARQLGCHTVQRGQPEVSSEGQSNVPRVYIAGDVSPDIKLVVVAAAEGAKAAYALNKDLLEEEGLVFLK